MPKIGKNGNAKYIKSTSRTNGNAIKLTITPANTQLNLMGRAIILPILE